MKLDIKVETERFNSVLRMWLLGTSRELSVALNARMSFLLMRMFALIPPQRVQERRNAIKAYMDHQVGERRFDKKTGKKIGRARILKRVHLIAQALNRKAGGKGLYGEEMKKAAASLRRKSIGSVGYLKSGLIGLIRKFNGHFTQYGGSKKVKGKLIQINPNMGFMKLMASYGFVGDLGNVAKHKGAKFRSFPARPGLNPLARGDLTIGIDEGQLGKVSEIYSQAAARAFADERVEMEKVIADRLQAAAEEAIDGSR